MTVVRRKIASLALLAGVAAVLASCEAKSHENKPRPPVPTTLSISVTSSEITVAPEEVGRVGRRPVNITQNRTARVTQADQRRGAVVDVRVSSLTGQPSRLFLEGPVEEARPIPGNGTTSFQAELPVGIYRLSSPASDDTTRFTVGPSRVSSATDVLTP